jgi:hypothetical protein
VIMGTFSFMSPEQVRGDRLGPESDVFSLGSVLAFAATGHGPFDSATVPGSSIALPRRTVDLTAPLRAVRGEAGAVRGRRTCVFRDSKAGSWVAGSRLADGGDSDNDGEQPDDRCGDRRCGAAADGECCPARGCAERGGDVNPGAVEANGYGR